MADEAAAEAAFLDAMRAQNNAAGGQEANGTASQLQTDSVSDDEYDPAVEMHAESLPTDAQDSVVPFPSSSAVKPLPLSAPQESYHPSTVSGFDDGQGSDQSRSMSPDSTQSLPGTPTIISRPEGESVSGPVEQEANTAKVGVGEATVPNGQTFVQASPTTIPNSLPGSLPQDHESIQNDVQGVPSAEVVQNSVVPSILEISATTADAGATSSGKSIARPSSTSAPQSQTDSKLEQTSAPVAAAPKARLPHDRIGILEDRIQADPRGDHDAWLSLISEHRQRGKLGDARKAYDRFFEVFPAAAEQWAAYAKMENEAQERLKMEGIFQLTLLAIPHLQLWSMYLDHVRRVNNTVTDTSGQARKTINEAFEFAIRHVGIDKEAGRLLQDYIQFLKSGPGVAGGSSWQDQQKMDVLRKAYQQAICIPTQAVTAIWKEYDQFENGLNKVTARKFLQERSASYMTARSENIKLQNITRNLRRTTLPVLPPAAGCDGYEQYMEQVGIWKQWIDWEKSDPLLLMTEDLGAYRDRVVFVYKQALMALRFWPEIWVDAADFCFLNDLKDVGDDFLAKGVEANPESCLLTFKKADRCELDTAGEEGEAAAIRRGKTIKAIYKVLLDALYDALAKEKEREAQELARIESQYANQAQQSLEKNENGEEEVNEVEVAELQARKEQHITAIKSSSAEYIQVLRQTVSHSWIAYMRSMRRIQGKGKPRDEDIGGSRLVFGEARKRGQITPDVYIESAYMEFHCYEPDIARKIFERGLKLYANDEYLALEYIKHLTNINDHTNARVVFEQSVAKLLSKPETRHKAKPLFAFFHEFESRFGELTGIMKLEARMKEHFPEDPKLDLFSQRFVAPNFDPRAVRVIVSPAAQTRPKIAPPPSTEAPPPIQTTPPKPISVQTGNSPKRPLPLDESDTEGSRPRKILRGESPPTLKGAAGRRMDQSRRARQNETPHLDGSLTQAPPPPLPVEISFFISILPKAHIFNESNPVNIIAPKAVQFLQTLYLPKTVAELEHIRNSRAMPQPVPQNLQHQPPLQQHLGYGQHVTPMSQMPPQQHGQYTGGYPEFPSQSCSPLDPRRVAVQYGGGNDPRSGYGHGLVPQSQAYPPQDRYGPPFATASPRVQTLSSHSPFGEQVLTDAEASARIDAIDEAIRRHAPILDQPSTQCPGLTFEIGHYPYAR